MKAQNYSAELTAKIVSDYQSGVDVTDIASAIDKSVRSVRSKLVREGVYVAKPRPTAKKVMGPTKKELLKELESKFGYDVSGVEGATRVCSALRLRPCRPTHPRGHRTPPPFSL